jgi:hypothetical protein
MSVADVLAEADADLATVRSVVDAAQHALDVAERTQRTGARLASRWRTLVVVAALGAVTLGVALAIRAVLARRSAASLPPVGSPDGPPTPPGTG